jgi:TLC domain
VDSIPFQLILCHSFGYFLFDLIWCYIHGEAGVMKFHHIVTVTGLLYYSFKLRQQYIIVYALGLTEFTNPFLQLRWYLKYHGMRDSPFFKIIEVFFIILFLYLRVVVFSYYTIRAWTDSSLNFSPDDLFFITLGLIVGYSLAYQMLGYIVYQLKKSNTQRVDKYE